MKPTLLDIKVYLFSIRQKLSFFEKSGFRIKSIRESITVYHATDTEPYLGQRSGYYPGTYSHIDESRVKDYGKNKFKTQVDISKIYKVGDSAVLKKEAYLAGFGIHSGSGVSEVLYLKSKGYIGLSRGGEFVLFDNSGLKFYPI